MRTVRSAAPVLSLVLVLSACSDDPAPSARATSTPSAPSPTASPRPSVPAPSASPAAAAPRAEVTASRVDAPAPSATASPTPAGADPALPAAPSPAAARAARLTGDGLDLPQGVVPFGTTVQAALPTLTAALGRPTRDTGVTSSFGVYGTCPGTRLRALEFGGGALVVLFGDVPGPDLTMYGWRLTPTGSAAGLPPASATVAGAGALEVGIGTSVTALRDAAGEAVQVAAGDEIVGPSFRLGDASSGLYGSLSAATGGGTVTSVQAGQPCGD